MAPDWIQSLAQATEATGPASPLATDVEWLPPMLLESVGPCRVSIGSATSRGLARMRNEDHFLTQQLCWSSGEDVYEATLLVVADGMGGEQAGDRASELVISTLAAVLGPVLAGLLRGRPRDTDTVPLLQALGQALREAHLTVSQIADGDAACKGMGSTAAVVVIRDGRAVISHVGDCRVYHQRGEEMTQVTRDHTLVARMVEMGQLTPEEAVNHPASNQITQALGKKGPFQPSQHELALYSAATGSSSPATVWPLTSRPARCAKRHGWRCPRRPTWRSAWWKWPTKAAAPTTARSWPLTVTDASQRDGRPFLRRSLRRSAGICGARRKLTDSSESS